MSACVFARVSFHLYISEIHTYKQTNESHRATIMLAPSSLRDVTNGRGASNGGAKTMPHHFGAHGFAPLNGMNE